VSQTQRPVLVHHYSSCRASRYRVVCGQGVRRAEVAEISTNRIHIMRPVGDMNDGAADHVIQLPPYGSPIRPKLNFPRELPRQRQREHSQTHIVRRNCEEAVRGANRGRITCESTDHWLVIRAHGLTLPISARTLCPLSTFGTLASINRMSLYSAFFLHVVLQIFVRKG
jgi:hypothetical protein